MELEELKSNWQKISMELDKQKVLTNELILKMAGNRSRSMLRSILAIERSGIALTSAMMIYIFFNMGRLNDWFSLTAGISTLVILMTGLIMSFILIKRIQNVDIVNNGYRQTLLDVNRIKTFQLIMKRMSAFLAPVLLITILPTFAALWFEKNLINDLMDFWESLIPGLVLIPVIWYILSRFYSQKLNDLNKLLKEYEQTE